jgi:hypothetical protein
MLENTELDCQNQHIYITSDEEIKEGDWFIDNNNSLKRSYKLSHVQFANPKKIILTTDQDLINDGVQAIDDEFLEWFVNNPSCEEVETKHIIKEYVDEQDAYGYDVDYWKIIIPKEEPKQETLEEALEREFPIIKELKHSTEYKASIAEKKLAFMFGAKWQAERMYSEEEVYHILCEHTAELFKGSKLSLTEWFKKFKK